MHHQLGGSNFASGSCTNSGSSCCGSNIDRIHPMEDESGAWHDRAAFVQDFGKAAEFTRPAVHKSSSQVPPKLVVTRSSGAQRSLRSRPAVPLQGQWNSLRSFPGSDDGSGPSNMETDTNLGIGLSTRLGLSEVPSLAGHRCTGNSQEYPFGKSGITVGSSSSNLYPGLVSAQSASVPEFAVGRGSGHVPDTGGFRVSASSGLAGRSQGVGSNSSYHSRNAVAEGNINNVSFGVAVTSSVPLDRQQRDGHPLIHHGNKSNFSMLPDSLMTSAGNKQVPLGEDASCSNDSLFCFNSGTLDRAQVLENRSPRGSFLGKSVSNSSSSAGTSSRASACKRKSCTSSALVSSFCRSGSPHSSGLREGYGMRSMGSNSTGRRSSNAIGCVSASDVVASASAVVAGRCVETSVAAVAVEEQRSRKSSIPRDGDSLGNSRGKYTSGGTSSTAPGSSGIHIGNNATGQQLDHQASRPTFPRAVRRAIPALQPDSWCSRSVALADCPTEVDFATNSANTLVRPTDQLIMHGGLRRSGSPSVGSSRSGSTFSSGRIDHTMGSSFGERLPYRYVSTNNRNMMSSASGAGSSIGTDPRLRVRNYLSASESSISSASVVTSPGHISPGAQGAVVSENLSGFSPSRLPHNPAVSTRPNSGNLHMSMLASPSTGFTTSRFPPSPPSMPSTLSSTMDILPSESSMFNGSLLPRSSVDGREFGLGTAENILGFPFRGLPLGDGEHQPRLVAEGLAEILLALDRVERDEDLTYEQLLMLEATLLFGGMGLHDQHSDLRLDVDNMSYEELLALEERIGNVSTGLTPDDVNKRLKKGRYSSQAAIIAGSQESDIKCSVCQEEYEDGDELGKIDCGHSYHIACIKQWLVQKNQCPICKASALS